MPSNVTTNRSYQLPHGLNYLDEDVLRLIAAFEAIDVDVKDALLGLLSKANTGHSHVISDVTGLAGALNNKMDVGESFELDELTDLNTSGVTSGQFLRYVGTEWISVTFDASFIASGIIAAARLPAHLTVAALNISYAPFSHTHPQSAITSLVSDLAAKAPLSHAHAAGDVTSGRFADARMPDRLEAFAKQVTNLNSAVTNGWYMIDAANAVAGNGPSGQARWAIGHVMAHNALWVTQDFTEFANSTPTSFLRWRRQSRDVSGVRTWDAWGSADVPVGGVVAVSNTQTGAVATTTTIMPSDDTIPQITEGAEFMTVVHTPKSATNKLKIDVVFNTATTTWPMVVGLFRDAVANALAAVEMDEYDVDNGAMPVVFSHFMTAGGVAAITFRVRAGPGAADTLTFNGNNSARRLGGVMASSITVTEFAA